MGDFYKNKYINYKRKYLELKNNVIFGGGFDKYIIVKQTPKYFLIFVDDKVIFDNNNIKFSKKILKLAQDYENTDSNKLKYNKPIMFDIKVLVKAIIKYNKVLVSKTSNSIFYNKRNTPGVTIRNNKISISYSGFSYRGSQLWIPLNVVKKALEEYLDVDLNVEI